MAKIKEFLRLHFPTRRRLIQLYAALLCNAHIKGYIKGEIYTGSLKNACVPGLNCYSCPGAVGACPLGALSNALASSDKRAPYFMFGILLLLGITFGRTICGFLCPFGLIQELLHKINVPKLRKSRVTHILSYLKYVILLIFVILIPLRYCAQSFPVPAFCKYICPAGTLEGAVGLLANPANESRLSMLNILFTRKFIIAVIIIAACIFIYRAFCRFLCPLGAIYGLFNRFSLLGIRVDTGKCTDCGKCLAHCKMDIRHVGDHECIHCGECIKECPAGAISYRLGKVKLISNVPENADSKKHSARVKAGICWAAALLVLAFVLWFANKPESGDAGESAVVTQDENGETVGPDAGDLCPDFTAPVYGSDTAFTLSEHRGKVVVINFWATYCTPCCAELPNFDKLYTTYKDQVDMIALHVQADYDGAENYLAGFDYQMPFGHDESGEIIKSLGGSTLLPMTVVVDQTGHIVYNDTSSMTYEKLEDIVLPLLKEDHASETAVETAESEAVLADSAETAINESNAADDAENGESEKILQPGDKFPDFTVTLSDGSVFTLSEALKDHKAVLINLWAINCNPCQTEFPYLNAAYKKYSDEVAVVCLTAIQEDTVDNINALKTAAGYDLPMGQDTAGVSKMIASPSIPVTILVDRFGIYAFSEASALPSEAAFERLFEYYISDDYTKSVVLDEIPPQKPDTAPLTDAELTAAVCPDGTLYFTTPTDDEDVWPFVKASQGGVTNSNACKDPAQISNYCTAIMNTTVEAQAGDVLAFDYTVDSENFYDGLAVMIDGEDKYMISQKESGTYVYEFPEAGRYEVSLQYLTAGYIQDSTDSVVIKNATLASGDQAEKLLAKYTKVFPQTLEGYEISMDIQNAKEIVFNDPEGKIASTFNEETRYFVSDDKEEANIHICLGKDANPSFASCEGTKSMSLAACDTDETGFICAEKLLNMEDNNHCYNKLSVDSDFGHPENSCKKYAVLFADEENLNTFIEKYFGSLTNPDQKITWTYADGTEPSTDQTAEYTVTSTEDAQSAQSTYTIHIVDETGTPLDGCMLNVCSDMTCSPSEAENGELTFTKEAYPYTIHVLRYPEGYEFDKDIEFIMPEHGGELTITIPHAK